VAIGLLAAAVLLLGSGSTLWQAGLRWPAQRFEQIHALRTELSHWPAYPLEICGTGDPQDWWVQIAPSEDNEWVPAEIWVIDQGWVEISGSSCEEIPPEAVSVIKIRSPHLETVVLVIRT